MADGDPLRTARQRRRDSHRMSGRRAAEPLLLPAVRVPTTPPASRSQPHCRGQASVSGLIRLAAATMGRRTNSPFATAFAFTLPSHG